MSLLAGVSIAQLDDLLETLWNLEDVHRELVDRVNRLIAHLEDQELTQLSS